MKQRDIYKGVKSIPFYDRFKSDDECLKYLSEIKWPDEGYHCPRCGNKTYHKGRTPYSRRCNKCKLIYTAITRAKKICVLVGSPKALNIAVKKQTVSDRNTKLKERLGG